MTPYLSELFSIKWVIVNSENLAWLATGVTSMKPDLFWLPKWAYTHINNIDGTRFGKVNDKRLYDTLYIVDCKMKCTHTAFGELIIHLGHQNTAKEHKISRGMLFGKSEFWLAIVQGTELLSRTVGHWDQKGAADCIKDFFEPLAWDGATDVCHSVGCDIPEPTVGAPSGFLGAGSNGRVLRVCKRDGHDIFALKVALPAKSRLLHKEYAFLKTHQSKCHCSDLVRVEGDCVTLASLDI